ncbi:MAG: tetratricopeptide repeat protein [Armatimonadetes bacterium]|nr:tetratricopeptide repeat protein [Armatimonadota bacterium]
MERFTRDRVLGILGVASGRLRYWERLGVVSPVREGRDNYYTLQDLIVLKRLVRLADQGLRVSELLERMEPRELYRALSTEQSLCVGRRLALSRGDDRVYEVETGQGILGFDACEERVVPLRRVTCPQNWMGIAEQARREGRIHDALVALEQALSVDGSRLEAWNQRGMLLLSLKRASEAVEAFRRALALQPTSSVVRYNLANALDELGETLEAVAELGRALALNPEHADSHFNRALGLEKMGRREEARYHWREYLRIEPSGESAQKVRQFLRDSEEHRVIPLRSGR